MPSNAPLWKGYSGLIETPKSGSFDYSDRITFVQEFEGTVSDVRIYASLHPRGSLYTIVGLTGAFFVEKTTVAPDRGGRATATTSYLYLGLTPPDEWSVTPFEINPALSRNELFSALTSHDLQLARAAFTSAQAKGQDSINNAIAGSTNAALTQLLVNKWLKGVETFYLAGLKYQWTQFLYSMAGIFLREGGYRETPGGPGVYPSGMTWLRQCDEVVWNNGIYRVTRTWVGGPSYDSGLWDPDIYPITPR